MSAGGAQARVLGKALDSRGVALGGVAREEEAAQGRQRGRSGSVGGAGSKDGLRLSPQGTWMSQSRSESVVENTAVNPLKALPLLRTHSVLSFFLL